MLMSDNEPPGQAQCVSDFVPNTGAQEFCVTSCLSVISVRYLHVRFNKHRDKRNSIVDRFAAFITFVCGCRCKVKRIGDRDQ